MVEKSEKPIVRIEVPYKKKTINFSYPFYGSDGYEKVIGKIDKDGFSRPTTAQTLSLIDWALKNPDKKHCAEILNIFKGNHFWTSTECLPSPPGIIVYNNTDGKNPMPSDRKGLLERMTLGDSRVKFVPNGFKEGEMPISEFLENPFVIAQVGKDMLPTLKRVAESYDKKVAYLNLNGLRKEKKACTALGSGWDSWLCLGVDGYGFCRGYAAGVLREWQVK